MPAPRPGHVDALGLYERGVGALQRRDYPQARDAFIDLLQRFPDEKELQDRSQVYLAACERHLAAGAERPRSTDERLYAATLAINAGDFDRAAAEATDILRELPNSDHAFYILAIAHAQRGAKDDAVKALARAVQLNPENRNLARRDPDLSALRSLEAYRAAVERGFARPAGRA
jgi:TolA-binding protein